MTESLEGIESGRVRELTREAKVVLMCGVSGSGKTRVSKIIETFGFVRLSVDEMMWKKYGSDFIDLPLHERGLIFREMGREVDTRLECLLREGKRVVVDSTMCKRARRDAVRLLCDKYGITPLIIYLDVPLGVLKSRLASRLGNGPDDLVVDLESLESYFSNFERPAEEECCVRYKYAGLE